MTKFTIRWIYNLSLNRLRGHATHTQHHKTISISCQHDQEEIIVIANLFCLTFWIIIVRWSKVELIAPVFRQVYSNEDIKHRMAHFFLSLVTQLVRSF